MIKENYFLKTDEIVALRFSGKEVRLYTKFDGTILFPSGTWGNFKKENKFEISANFNELITYDNNDEAIAVVYTDLHKLSDDDFKVEVSENESDPVKVNFKINDEWFKFLLPQQIYNILNDVRSYGKDTQN